MDPSSSSTSRRLSVLSPPQTTDSCLTQTPRPVENVQSSSGSVLGRVIRSLMEVSNAKDLKELYENLGPNQDNLKQLLIKISTCIVESFSGDHPPRLSEDVQEIVEILEIEDLRVYRKATLVKLLECLDKAEFYQDEVLEALILFFGRYQKRILYEVAKHPPKDAEALFEIENLNSDHYVKILVKLIRKLTIHQQADTEKSTILSLKAVVMLLGLMGLLGVRGLKREANYEPALKDIVKLKKNPNLHIVYLSHYAEYALSEIGSNESNLHSILRRSWYILQGLAKIADAVDPKAPWRIPVGLINSIPDFKRAFSHIGGASLSKAVGRHTWFDHTNELQNSLFEGKFDFQPFLDHITKPEKKNQEQLRKHYHFDEYLTVRGFVGGLRRCLKAPTTGEELRKQIIQLLAQICEDNPTKEKKSGVLKKFKGAVHDQFHKNIQLFTLEKNRYRRPLCAYIFKGLCVCSDRQSSHVPVNENHLNNVEQIHARHKPLKSFPRVLFDGALHVHASWREGLLKAQRVIAALWEGKKQSYVEPVVVECGNRDFKTLPLYEGIQEFLNKEGSGILLLEGDEGSGKTFNMHKLALDIFNEGRYFAIYKDLAKTQYPTRNIFEEAFDELGISNQAAEQVLTREIVWIFDARDEMRSRDKIKLEKLIENGVRFKAIFTCRNYHLRTVQRDNPWIANHSISISSLVLNLFDDRQQTLYIQKYFESHPDHGDRTGWDAPKYDNFLSRYPVVRAMARQPEFLELLIQFLPGVDENAEPPLTTPLVLMHAFFCYRIEREIGKSHLEDTHMKQDYLDYAIRLAFTTQQYAMQLGLDSHTDDSGRQEKEEDGNAASSSSHPTNDLNGGPSLNHALNGSSSSTNHFKSVLNSSSSSVGSSHSSTNDPSSTSDSSSSTEQSPGNNPLLNKRQIEDQIQELFKKLSSVQTAFIKGMFSDLSKRVDDLMEEMDHIMGSLDKTSEKELNEIFHSFKARCDKLHQEILHKQMLKEGGKIWIVNPSEIAEFQEFFEDSDDHEAARKRALRRCCPLERERIGQTRDEKWAFKNQEFHHYLILLQSNVDYKKQLEDALNEEGGIEEKISRMISRLCKGKEAAE